MEFWDTDAAAKNPAEHSGCQYAADCQAWLQSGCDPALVGRNPVLTTSIVAAEELADGKTPRTLHMRAPSIPPWGLYPGVVIQFWRHDCTEIADSKLHTTGEKAMACSGHVGSGSGSCRFEIPVDTAWMTLSGYVTTVGLSWALS